MYNCKLDDKVNWIYKLMRMPLSHVPYFFYPRIYKVTMVGEPDAGWGDYPEGSSFMTKPNLYPASMEKLGSKDAYIMDNGEYIFLYLGNQVSDNFIYNVKTFTFIKLFLVGIRLLKLQRPQIQRCYNVHTSGGLPAFSTPICLHRAAKNGKGRLIRAIETCVCWRYNLRERAD